MKWITLLTRATVITMFAAMVSGCGDCENSHREYVITHSQLNEDVSGEFTE